MMVSVIIYDRKSHDISLSSLSLSLSIIPQHFYLFLENFVDPPLLHSHLLTIEKNKNKNVHKEQRITKRPKIRRVMSRDKKIVTEEKICC